MHIFRIFLSFKTFIIEHFHFNFLEDKLLFPTVCKEGPLTTNMNVCWFNLKYGLFFLMHCSLQKCQNLGFTNIILAHMI